MYANGARRVLKRFEEFSLQDFEVNVMTFTDDVTLTKSDGSTDYTFLSTDCFHLSQKGHSKMKSLSFT